MKFILSLLAVALVIGGLTWDNTVHVKATWVSHVLFWPAFVYALIAIWQSLRKPNLNKR